MADAVPAWFVVEESFWLFCDTGGRQMWRQSHNGTFIKYKDWIDICRTVWEDLIVSDDKRRFWKSSGNVFGRFKNRMDVSFAFILSTDRTRVLLVQTVTRNTLSLPGGKCFLVEGESVQDCLFRELKEELGWGETDGLHIEDTQDVFEGRNFHLFLLYKDDSTPPPTIDRKEVIDYKWVTSSEARGLNISSLCSTALNHWIDKMIIQ